jgi:hypothetical protein
MAVAGAAALVEPGHAAGHQFLLGGCGRSCVEAVCCVDVLWMAATETVSGI